MTGKNEHACTVCKKTFASAKAMAQHRKAAHAGGKSSQGKKQDAPVAKALRGGPTKSSSGAREAGRDRFAHFDDISSVPAGKSLLSVLFSPHQLPRCSVLAKAYQRYVVHSLSFHIVPMISSATSGGYVAAFVRDPEDSIRTNAANIVTATAGSVTSKWWEDTVVRCPSLKDQFYTATTPGQERFSSPGALVIAVDGQATQKGSLTVYVEYNLSFYAPGLEAQKESGVVKVKDTIRMAAGNSFMEVSASKSTKYVDMFEGATLQDGMILETPHPIYYLINDAGAISGLAAFKYLKLGSKVVPCTEDGTDYSELTYGNATILFKDDQCNIRKTAENFQVGSEFLCNQISLEPSSVASTSLTEASEEVCTQQRRAPTISGEPSMPSEEALLEIISSAQALLLRSQGLQKEQSQA